MGADPVAIKQIAFGLSIATAAVAGSLLIIIGPVEPSIDREYIGRVFAIVVLGGMGSIDRHRWSPPSSWASPRASCDLRSARPGRRRSRSASCCSRWRSGRKASSADDHEARASSVWSASPSSRCGRLAAALIGNEYYFFAAYAILQSMIMAIAWNILGGFTGYVNFGSAGFFAVGAYTTVALSKALRRRRSSC